MDEEEYKDLLKRVEEIEKHDKVTQVWIRSLAQIVLNSHNLRRFENIVKQETEKVKSKGEKNYE